MSNYDLPGLEGTNPLGFLAALGIQVVFANKDVRPRLWWSGDITPHAIVDSNFPVDKIVSEALDAFSHWKNGFALNPKQEDGTPLREGDTLKLKSEDIRNYLGRTSRCKWSRNLATALLAEGSLDNKGSAKPSDLYFTAGQQKFLGTARNILSAVSKQDLESGLIGPWPYDSNLPSFGWDIADDRLYALRAIDPSLEKKASNPGPEALALLGLSMYSVYAGQDRTITQGCSGKWKRGYFSWPIWRKSASLYAVKSLLAHTHINTKDLNRQLWYRSWGISAVYRSPIRRSSQGGYGTFGPSEIVWQQNIE